LTTPLVYVRIVSMNRPEDPRFSPEIRGGMNNPSNPFVDLKDFDKAAVLAALYNGAKPQGLGFLQYDPTPMSIEEARDLLKKSQDFDYLKGRVMKVDLSGDQLDPRGYDRDNGENAAQTLIDSLRETSDPNNPSIHGHHVIETKQSEQRTRELLYEDPSYTEEAGEIPSIHLGLSDMAKYLEPRLREARESLGNDESKKE